MRIRASQNARLISLLITIVVELPIAAIVTVVKVVTTVDYLNMLKVVRAVWVQRRQPGKKLSVPVGSRDVFKGCASHLSRFTPPSWSSSMS